MNTKQSIHILSKRLFLVLFFLYFVFIVYASITFGVGGSVRSGSQSHWLFIFRSPFARNFNSLNYLKDIAVNILFYLPLGIITALLFDDRKPRYFTPLILVGFGTSVVLEFIQSFIGRYADALDILTNTLGYVFGYWVVIYSVKRFRIGVAEVLVFSVREGAYSKVNVFISIRFVYGCVYTLIALLPFDINVYPRTVYEQLFANVGQAQRIIIDPLYHFNAGEWMSSSWMIEFLGYLPLAVFTSFIGVYRKKFSWIDSVLYCMIFAAVIEISQVFIMSQSTDVYNIFIAAFSGIIGWVGIRLWCDVSKRNGFIEQQFPRVEGWGFLVAMYLLFLCLVTWAPYQFELSLRIVANKIIHESNWIPFNAHLRYHSVANAVDLMKEAGLFAPLGILLSFGCFKSIRSKYFKILMVGSLCFVFSSLLEMSQSICVGRYVDVTDVIMAVLGGVIGSILGLIKIYSQKKTIT